MTRITGYLAQVDNVPPLVFRFQFNPEMLQEKRSIKYRKDDAFAKWDFSQAAAASGVFTLDFWTGLYKDAKGLGPNLNGAKAQTLDEYEARELEIEFKLDASVPGPMDGDMGDSSATHYDGSIEPDLAILRGFVNPAWEPLDLLTAFSKRQWTPCPGPPPEVKFIYAGLSIDAVMTELNIKHTAFQDDGKPLRADVQVKLVEQSYSVSPLIEYGTRSYLQVRGMFRHGGEMDLLRVTPGVGSIVSLFE
jgi:Contractile injection system tube protein